MFTKNLWERKYKMSVLEIFKFYFSYSFVRYAVVVGILISLCSSLLGVNLVLKRYSYIGDGLSHVAFGAMAVAAVIGLTDNMLIVLPVTILAAVLMIFTGNNSKINGDAAIAMISVSSLAIGYLLMHFFSTSSNISGDVCSTLFGSTSILTLSSTDVAVCIILSVIVIAGYIFFYNKIFAVTFDENFARATGMKVSVYNFVFAVVTAAIIVLAMNLVGSLLISALVIFPALSSMQVFKNFRAVVLCSAVISVTGALAGIVLAVLYSTPVGSTIVAIDLCIFICMKITRAVMHID
jgi:zinc transport system permease protein